MARAGTAEGFGCKIVAAVVLRGRGRGPCGELAHTAGEAARLADHANAPASPGDLDALILATAPRAVAYAASLLRDAVLAEDVVQDCYCRLLQKAGEYDLPRDGAKLLFRAVTNACINHTTRRRPV